MSKALSFEFLYHHRKTWEVDLDLDMDAMSNVSIIIPAYNSERTIGLVLEALEIQDYGKGQVEVILIDDASSDSTTKICEAHGVKVVRNKRNSGLAYTLNVGVRLSRYEIIVTLHSDTIPLSSRWLSELTEPLTDPSVAASCSLQQAPDCNSDDLSLWEKLLWAKLDEHNALNNKADAYKKKVIADVGFFDDETFRIAGEDEDMALRLRLAGYRVVGTSAKVLHTHLYSSHKNRLVQILKREYIFGQAGGALRRKNRFYKPGAYVHPYPKPFFFDGVFRAVICMGSLLPYVQIMCLPLLLFSCLLGISQTAKVVGATKTLLLYPVFNLLRYWFYTFGYIRGAVTKKQR